MGVKFSQESKQLVSLASEAVGKIVLGEESTYEKLYEVLLPYVVSVIQGQGLGDKEIVEVAKDIFANVFLKVTQLDNLQEIIKWLTDIATGETIRFYKNNGKKLVNGTFKMDEYADNGMQRKKYFMFHKRRVGEFYISLPKDCTSDDVKQQMLKNAYWDINPEDKMILCGKVFKDESFMDMANQYNSSMETITAKYFRALNMIQDPFVGEGYVEGLPEYEDVEIKDVIIYIYYLVAQSSKIAEWMKKAIWAKAISLMKTSMLGIQAVEMTLEKAVKNINFYGDSAEYYNFEIRTIGDDNVDYSIVMYLAAG